MKSAKVKTFLMAAAWCATAAGAFWYGRHSVPETKANLAAGKGRGLADRGPTVVINAANGGALKVPTTDDLLHGKGKPTADDLKAWADSLDPAQCAALLTDLEKLPGGDPRDAMIDAMIASWATRDPDNYLAGYSKVSNPRSRETGVSDALKAMAEKDPKNAAKWLAESKDAVPNQMLALRYRSAIQGMAASDPQTAFDFVKGLDTGSMANAQIQRQGLNAVADAMAASGKFNDAIQMFASLTDPAQRSVATNEVMMQWAQSNPTDASKYITSLTDPAQRTQYANQVVASWARNDPQAAAAFAAQLDASGPPPDGQLAGQALANAMRSWSRYDLDGPAQFLNTLTPSAATDPAVVTFTMQARNVDPSTALVWAGQITDQATREKTLGSVALRVLASGNQADLNKLLSSNVLTPDQVTWLQGLPTDNPQALNRMGRRLGANFATNPGRNGPWATAQPAPAGQQASGAPRQGGIFQGPGAVTGRGGRGGGGG